ncbi:MAG TPA: hypothetical protein VF611_10130, partial [Pyrinomonadaceae bacterium]
MLTAGLITSILLSVAALWLALSRARGSGREVGRDVAGPAEPHGLLWRELAELRGRVESEGERVGRQEARLDALVAAQRVARRELKAAVKKRAAERKLAAAVEAAAPGGDTGRDESRATPPPPLPPSQPVKAGDVTSEASGLACVINEFFNATTHPRELLGHETFERGVELLRGSGLPTHTLTERALDCELSVSCMALEALARREGDDEAVVSSTLRDINLHFYWPRFFALRALAAHAAGRAVLAPLLARLNPTWREPLPLELLREFVAARVAAGETLT